MRLSSRRSDALSCPATESLRVVDDGLAIQVTLAICGSTSIGTGLNASSQSWQFSTDDDTFDEIVVSTLPLGSHGGSTKISFVGSSERPTCRHPRISHATHATAAAPCYW